MKPGDRIKITGGCDEDSPLRQCAGELRGTVVSFVPGYDPVIPEAIVRLDSPLTISGITGDVLVMELRYSGESWDSSEPGARTVSLALCSDIPAGPAPASGHGVAFETHAAFEPL